MYPANFFGLFPAFPRSATIFVAMSFDPRFDHRWSSVIRPAIEELSIDGKAFQAVRVDARVVGDSILTEILDGIRSAQLIFADVTSMGTIDTRAVRNGNVMYEVGLAHAVRLPEEVLLFRSDRDALLFDTSHIRVNSYSPDQDDTQAKTQVLDAFHSALREIDLKRHLAVAAVADSLDAASFEILIKCQQDGRYVHPPRQNYGQAMAAVSLEAALQRLLTAGVLGTSFRLPEVSRPEELRDAEAREMVEYRKTRFGDAVFDEVATRVNRSLNLKPSPST
jgi:hypothetical protein